MTGVKNGAFGISVNARHSKESQTLISILKQNNIPALWLVRKIFIEEETYAAATKRLLETNISCPIYFIVSGLKDNEGMVIEKDTDGVKAYYELDEVHWFLVQTNSDRDVPDPIHDPRRIPVEKRMEERGNANFDENVLFKNFMSEWPSFNIATIFTDIMIPATGYTNTTMWYGADPKQQQRQ